MSKYIRQAALSTASPIDVEQLRGAVEKLRRDVMAGIVAIATPLGMATGDAGSPGKKR